MICDLDSLQSCLHQLPSSVRHQLPANLSEFNQILGQRGAMVMPVEDRSIAGLILTSPDNIPESLSVNLSGSIVSLNLENQRQLTLWHEMGHLEAKGLLDSGFIDELTPYMHEWLADCYLAWRVAQETGSLELIWQQYHRRNLDLMQNVTAMSHWTVPILSQLLNRYTLEELMAFERFSDLMDDILPQLALLEPDSLDEFSSLVHRTFSTEVLQPLPNYMFWRKPDLGRYLEPTLIKLLGNIAAEHWLREQNMLAGNDVLTEKQSVQAEP
ncbi:conserved hypothetical protein [Shewanella sediminis HAW-EB3]|uniref:Uncharacterized protein n=2 Tax=Shewanella sediminis TaxID=271097 RepID=A8FZZ2_SHESH|nr:conserved hypothetical protein [Shewanella sediminis HAW-EB3]